MRVSKIQVGDKFINNQGCKAIVHEYRDHKNVVLVFQDKHNTKVTTYADSVRTGSFYNPMNPTVFEVGYIGVGSHKSSYNGVKNKTYSLWMNMMQRSYSKSVHEIFPTYENCSVDPIWHNFQNFAEWLENNKYYRPDYQVDKDLIQIGNKVYSPDLCSLIPRELNMLLNTGGSLRNGLPSGIRYSSKHNRYSAGFSKNGKWKNIGSYKCLKQAMTAYKIEKENYIRQIAAKYRGLVDERVIDTLEHYEVLEGLGENQ